MADFLVSYQITMSHEGGWVNHPNDRGQETYKGIARRFWPNWEGWKIIDDLKSKNRLNETRTNARLEELVKSFYKREFWDSNRTGEINDQNVANEIFDSSVNLGREFTARLVQRALNLLNRNGKDFPDLLVDGKIGPATIRTINNYRRGKFLFNALNGLQFVRYLEICERNPTQEEFFHGWLARVEMM
jgi:lysozyme family protein